MMGRKISFCVCLTIAVLAMVVLGVGSVQLLCVWDGSYDPIRDDGAPPDYLPMYYARVALIMTGSIVVIAAAFVGASLLRPRTKQASCKIASP